MGLPEPWRIGFAMNFLRRLGFDTYMFLLLGTVGLGLLLPAQGLAADILGHVTYWAVALLFFLYGARLEPAAVRAGLLNWRLQGLVFIATFVMFPLLGLALAAVFGPVLGAAVTLGLLFLTVLPSTVQSAIAFTSLAGGNVPAAICAASISNLIGVVLTPLLVAVLLSQGGGEVHLDAILKISVQILLPFAIGQMLRRWIGAFVQRHRMLTLTVDRGSILLIVYSAFSASTVARLWDNIPPQSLLVLFAVVLLLLALAMGLMMLAARTFGLPQADRIALFFCGSTKSLATGLPIATALFPAEIVGATVLPLMIYHMSQLLVCALIAQRANARLRKAGV